MMTIRTLLVGVGALALAVFSAPRGDEVRAEALPPLQGNEVRASLINPGVQDKMGLPDLLTIGTDAELTAASRVVADVLWADLDFEREYYMIGRKESASIPVTSAEALPYDRWAELGADVVLAADASRSGDTLTLRVRIMHVRGDRRGQNPFAAAYTCRVSQPRFCAHSIADDVHKQTKALDGVARTKLAFASDRDASRVTGRPSQTSGVGKEIYIADYDGAGQQRFTVNRNLNISPAWAPGGGRLAYTSWISGNLDIYVANLREPGQLRRPAGGSEAVSNSLAAWSPDGSRLAFVSNRSGNSDVWVVNYDGTNLLNLTNNRAADGTPTWSPDGSRIAFTSDRETGSTPFLYVMNSSGGAVQRLSGERADRPTWSAQNFIAFTAGTNGNYDIGIIEMDSPSRQVLLLTNGLGTNE